MNDVRGRQGPRGNQDFSWAGKNKRKEKRVLEGRSRTSTRLGKERQGKKEREYVMMMASSGLRRKGNKKRKKEANVFGELGAQKKKKKVGEMTNEAINDNRQSVPVCPLGLPFCSLLLFLPPWVKLCLLRCSFSLCFFPLNSPLGSTLYALHSDGTLIAVAASSNNKKNKIV